MSLATYQRKRDFRRTPEPKGRKQKSAGNRFVVQKHDASRLHYDFRLEHDGVLKSWAVPKGPCYDPGEKRLAVEVEDHPLEYAGFEGVIPPGQYGGGTVMLWDRGTWEPEGDDSIDKSLRNGKLKLRLHGEKLHGGWALIRTRAKKQVDKPNWLFIKEKDDDARPLDEYDVLTARPDSIDSGRTMEQIANERDREWTSAGETEAGGNGREKQPAKRHSIQPGRLKRSKKSSLPKMVKPQLASLRKHAPQGSNWLHEIKFDGYRILARVDDGDVRLYSRNGKDWTEKFAAIADAVRGLPRTAGWLDGEVVALESNGVSSFQALQRAFEGNRADQLIYQVFDLPYASGYDLTNLPLADRKEQLSKLLGGETNAGRVRYTDHMAGQGPEFAANACRLGLEGIISKQADAPYTSGRGNQWLKIKCVSRDELVIAGFTDPSRSRKGFGALLLGYYENKELRYAGRVGTGFTDAVLTDMRRQLDKLKTRENPFVDIPRSEAGRGTHWVEPKLVAQVEYSNWTADGRLRHPAFLGLREDKAAKDIRRPEAAGDSEPARQAAERSKGKTMKPASEAPTAHDIALPPELANVKFTNPDRVLFPEQGLTKIGLATYYARVAEWMLPHLVDRPLSIVRCPQGQGEKCFYQKHAGASVPDTVGSVKVQEKSKQAEYLTISDIAGLMGLVQIGALEIHPWGAKNDRQNRPDRLIFDLDPDPSVKWKQVIEAAQALHDLLDDLGLVNFVKTTGGKGLHVVVPIDRRTDWPDAKAFTKAVAERLSQENEGRFTTNMSKAARRGKIFIDYLRNDHGATSIAPYSTRAKPQAPVSVPLSWDELSTDLTSDHFNVDNLPARLSQLDDDPWAELFDVRQSITAAMKKEVGS